MLLFNILSALAMSLILLLPETSIARKHKPCCPCTMKSTICPGATDCNCSCPCGGVATKQYCLIGKNEEDNTATFRVKGEKGEEFALPLIDNDVLEGKKIGDCGFITVPEMPVCTEFDTSGATQSEKPYKPSKQAP